MASQRLNGGRADRPLPTASGANPTPEGTGTPQSVLNSQTVARPPRPNRRRSEPKPRVIAVKGFKSVRDEISIELRPLTLLCGSNSSGKSAFMQPLLLIKQTLEVGYDPGPLLLDGPNVSFGRASEMLWKGKAKADTAKQFSFSYTGTDGERSKFTFLLGKGGIDLASLEYTPPLDAGQSITLRRSLTHEQLREFVGSPFREIVDRDANSRLQVERQRCFFEIRFQSSPGRYITLPIGTSTLVQDQATSLLHLPGLRDLPARLYPATRAGRVFPGPFHPYVASVIATWAEGSSSALIGLNQDLQALGLTWKVEAQKVGDTKVALRVGRLTQPQQGGARDLVNIADVGLGVSQTLPVLVALRAAASGQIVYLEQPEIHLHPRAQVALGPVLVGAARRGVIVVCETHSHLLVRSIQAQTAGDQLDPALVALHWFTRDGQGVTQVTSGGLDNAGTYGDWPLDFNDVELGLENDYLDLIQRAW